MTIETFVATFKSNNDKAACCKERIVKRYVPFLTKVTECNRVVNATMVEPDSKGNMVYKQKTPMRYLIFSMTLIGQYTDIEFENDNIADAYDKLDESGALEYFMNVVIPQREVKEFNTLLSMVTSDYMENKRALLSYFESAVKDQQ